MYRVMETVTEDAVEATAREAAGTDNQTDSTGGAYAPPRIILIFPDLKEIHYF